AALELGEQVERGECPRPDFVVLPSGSGGTLAGRAVGVGLLRWATAGLAGLAIGFAILGWPTTVIGVRITDRIACNRFTVGHLVRSCTRYLRRQSERYRALTLPAVRYSLFQGAIGRGYGYPT